MTELRRRAHKCWMGGAAPESCATCFDCIGEPYEIGEFIPQLRAIANTWRKAKAKGWTRNRGEFHVGQDWVLQVVLYGISGGKHYLNANKNGNVWFSPVNMNCF